MDTEDILRFRQNDLPYISFAAFEDMRNKGQLCDLTIKVQDHTFMAHRVILAAGIPYFRSVFTKGASETEETEISVKDLNPRALEALIHFAYTGEVTISSENVQSLLVASEFLKISQVRDACVEFLSKRLNVNNVARIFALASNFNNANLTEISNTYIRKNFEEFSKCGDFLNVPYSSFKAVISQNDLNVSNEETVLDAVIKWVESSPSERHEMLPDLLSEVRMTYLPVDYLIERVEAEELIMSSKPCRDLINEVKNYHLSPKMRSTCPNLKTLPRLYCERDLYAVCHTFDYSLYRLDVKNELWRSMASKKNEYRRVNAISSVEGKIYMFLDETIQIFDVKSQKWETLESRHKCIAGASIVSKGNMIYFFGSKDCDFKYKIRSFDTQLNKWMQKGELRTSRLDAAAASLGEFIYLTGGYDGEEFINTVEKYIPSSSRWSYVASMLTPRAEHGCTDMNRKIYVCGGVTTNHYILNTGEMYDLSTDQWSFISAMKNIRCRFSLVSHNTKMYALANSLGTRTPETDIEIYDPECDQWKTTIVEVPVGFQAAVLVPRLNN